MQYTFHAFGHENILSTHSTTFEFTKDDFLTKQGDCIIGIKADFTLEKIKELIKERTTLHITLEANNQKEIIQATIHKNFSSDHEIVIRKTDFLSERTLAIHADKAAKDLSKNFIEQLKNPKTKIKISMHSV